LLAKVGVDVTDPAFWDLGLQLLDEMVTDAEGLAREVMGKEHAAPASAG
jgi:oligoendopeptidase F